MACNVLAHETENAAVVKIPHQQESRQWEVGSRQYAVVVRKM
jgi:hypothetical protein